MSDRDYEAIHPQPVWRDRADFIIAADISSGDKREWEQLWARKLDTYSFELCCIPFFAYDMCLGDIVETNSEYVVIRVVQAAGHWTFRVWFGDSYHPRDEVKQQLEALGTLVEWSSQNLLAIDASDDLIAQNVADLLARREKEGVLTFETGRSAN